MKKVTFESKVEFKGTQRLTEAHMISNGNKMPQFDLMLKPTWDSIKGFSNRKIIKIDVKFTSMGIIAERTYSLTIRSYLGKMTYSLKGVPHEVRNYEMIRNALIEEIVKDAYPIKAATGSVFVDTHIIMELVY